MLAEIRACSACAADLPLGPRPVLQASQQARLMICGQAPGTKVHLSGKPYDDRSGDRLRQWLGIGPDIFYDPQRVAIVPMGFCYPGRDLRGGDLPPRRECAGLWHAQLFPLLTAVELTLVIGQYAMAWHLGTRRKATLTETVRAWREYLPAYIPLPHPSWRNTGWLKRNPWFEAECVPVLQAEVRRRVASPQSSG
jgi:uracil-DNA glycosylase